MQKLKAWIHKLNIAYKVIFIKERTLEESKRLIYKPWYAIAVVGLGLITAWLLGFALLYMISFFNSGSSQQGMGTGSILPNGNSSVDTEAIQKQLVGMQDKLSANELYINNLKKIINPNYKPLNDSTALQAQAIPKDIADLDLDASKKDSIFRAKVKKEKSKPLVIGNSKTKEASNNDELGLLFTPLRGVITGTFDVSTNHLAIDIAAKVGESIKAAESGHVIFTDWTAETGYVVVLVHDNDLQTVYKHNSVVYKKVGDFIKKGEVLSAVGNTGELTTGPHLHFELWQNGKAINPEEHIQF